MNRLDRDAIGIVFAVVGMGACGAVYYTQHTLLKFGPAIRAAIHNLAGVPL